MDVEVSTPRKQRREKLDGTEECGRSVVGLIWFGASADQPQASEQHWNNGVTSAHLAVRRATLLILL